MCRYLAGSMRIAWSRAQDRKIREKRPACFDLKRARNNIFEGGRRGMWSEKALRLPWGPVVATFSLHMEAPRRRRTRSRGRKQRDWSLQKGVDLEERSNPCTFFIASFLTYVVGNCNIILAQCGNTKHNYYSVLMDSVTAVGGAQRATPLPFHCQYGLAIWPATMSTTY